MGKKSRTKDERPFKDAFLDELTRAFELRRRAIRYSLGRAGEGLSIERDAEEFEQLRVAGDSYPDPMITLLVRSGTADLEIRRSTKKAGGKVVLRLTDLRLTRNPSRIVAAFERTVNELGYVSIEEIRAFWAEVELVCV